MTSVAWPDGVEAGDRVVIQYHKRGRRPSHHRPVSEYVIDVESVSERCDLLKATGPWGMHTQGTVHVHGDGGVYVAEKTEGHWSTQIGRHARIRRLDEVTGQ